MLYRVTSHFYFLENLMNRLLEHCTNHLRTRMPSMSCKISFESIVVISLRPKVSLVKKSHLWFPLPLLLILFNPFVLVNPIHQLVHASCKFHCQGLSQIMLSREANFKRPYCHIFKIFIYLIKRFLVSRDGNFALPRLTRPSPLRPVRVFPTPQKWWGGDGARFQTRTTGRGGDGFTFFRPTPPHPRPALH